MSQDCAKHFISGKFFQFYDTVSFLLPLCRYRDWGLGVSAQFTLLESARPWEMISVLLPFKPQAEKWRKRCGGIRRTGAVKQTESVFNRSPGPSFWASQGHLRSFLHPSSHSPDLDLPLKLTWPRPWFLLSALFFPSVPTGTLGNCYCQRNECQVAFSGCSWLS